MTICTGKVKGIFSTILKTFLKMPKFPSSYVENILLVKYSPDRELENVLIFSFLASPAKFSCSVLMATLVKIEMYST
jgi:hypothetical protein